MPSALAAMPIKASMSAMTSGCWIETLGVERLSNKSCSALLIDVSADRLVCSSFIVCVHCRMRVCNAIVTDLKSLG